MIGVTLDRYRIDSKLGEGGMGVVYKGRDTQLDRTVAIKVLPSDKVLDPDRKRRFVQEARAASALNHPGIVTVYDIRSDAGIDFIVMEYIAGRTLDQIIPPKGLRIPQALRYGVAMADALAVAHQAGIVHRDLKPSNVMVTEDDRVKILDFGLAKLLDSEDASNELDTRTSPLTEVGTVVGTAAYMSPEQADGRHVDSRSDIFSFGSLLYEMVTGRRAFLADSQLSTLAKILHEDPPRPSHLAASVPPELERTILRCLRKDPARRFQTMADLKVVLEDLATDSTGDMRVPDMAPRASGGARLMWATVILLPLLLIGAYLAVRAGRSSDGVLALRAIPLTSLPGVKRSPSFSPDGNQIAYSWSGPNQDNTDVYIQQIGAGSPLRLTTDPADDYSPIWSPDGQSIAFLRRTVDPQRHEVRLIPPLGGPERKLTEIHPHIPHIRPLTLAWCPDSSCLVVTDSPGASKADALFAISVESGEKKQLTDPKGVFGDRDPAISPDGKWLVFRRDPNPFTGELYRLPLGTNLTVIGEPIRLTPTGPYGYPRWMPGSTEILLSARGALWRLGIFDGGAPKRLPFVGEDGLMPMVSVSQPGQPSRLVYVRSFTDSNIWRLETAAPGEATTSSPVVAIFSTRREDIPQLSPDGRRVAFTSDRSGELEIWVADVSGANAVRLTSQAALPGFPRWSPDGELIAYHSDAEGPAGDVFLIAAAGGKPRNLTAHPAGDAFPSFSRDGRWIYFSSSRTGVVSIWKVPTSGGTAVQVSPGPGLLALESADGADLYYSESAAMDRPGRLMRIPVKDGVPVKVLDDVDPMSFEVLDRGIYYVEHVAGESRLRYYDFASRQSTLVARNLGRVTFGLAASRDGRTILFSRVDSSVDDLMLLENFR